jgi:hypothetical protein
MEHLDKWLVALQAAHFFALAIVNLTETPKDDEALGRAAQLGAQVYKALELLAGIGPFAKR